MQDAIGISRRAPKIIALVISVGQQAAEFSDRLLRWLPQERVEQSESCQPDNFSGLASGDSAFRNVMARIVRFVP
jgi:hypothetical protein